MKKLNFVVDLDDTCFGWVEWLINEVGEVPEDTGLRHGSIFRMFPEIHQDVLLGHVQDVRGYTEATPIADASKSLTWMLMNFPVKISYVSAAPKEAVQGRFHVMNNSGFPLPWTHPDVRRLIHTGGHREKEEWILEHGDEIDFIIDDGSRYLDAAKLKGVPHRYLMDRPWNWDNNGHLRVLSWGHVRNQFHKDILNLFEVV